MSTSTSAPVPTALSRAGSMTMVALDQRGSLRTILANGNDEATISDSDISSFKRTAAQALAPLATAVLLDRQLGKEAIAALGGGVPLILSADRFEQEPGGPVARSHFDDALTADEVTNFGAAALKLLLIWKPGTEVDFRAEQNRKLLELAEKTGTLSLVEGIVRTADGERYTTTKEHGEAVVAAAVELTQCNPSVYKAEVPGYLPGQLDMVEEYSRKLTASIDQPWVVLSNGVEASDFPEAVRLAVRGGASGFLAGRAIWADAAGSADVVASIEGDSRDRLQQLIEIVGAEQGSR